MFQGFKKATPYGGARKLRLTLPTVRRATLRKRWPFEDLFESRRFYQLKNPIQHISSSIQQNFLSIWQKNLTA